MIRKEKQTLQQPNWNFLPFFQVLFLIEEYLTLLSLLSDYSRVEGSYSSSQLSQFQQFLLRADKYNSLDIFGNVAPGKIILVEVLLHFFDWCYFAQSYNWKSLPPFHCQWKQRERGGGAVGMKDDIYWDFKLYTIHWCIVHGEGCFEGKEGF